MTWTPYHWSLFRYLTLWRDWRSDDATRHIDALIERERRVA